MALPVKTLKKLKKKMTEKQLYKYLKEKHGYKGSKEEIIEKIRRT